MSKSRRVCSTNRCAANVDEYSVNDMGEKMKKHKFLSLIVLGIMIFLYSCALKPTEIAQLQPDPTQKTTETSLPPTVMPIDTLTPTPTPTATSTQIPTLTNTSTITPTPTQEPGAIRVREIDRAIEVFIPAGVYPFGVDESETTIEEKNQWDRKYGEGSHAGMIEEFSPQVFVDLNSFWIDKFPVTNNQFVEFLNTLNPFEAMGLLHWSDSGRHFHQNGPIWTVDKGYTTDKDYGEHPATHVNYYGASNYCEWVGARLPTEVEWEAAARGFEGNRYPWGNEFDCNKGNFNTKTCDEDPFFKERSPVNHFPQGASVFGVIYMAGNTYDITSTFWDPNIHEEIQEKSRVYAELAAAVRHRWVCELTNPQMVRKMLV